MDETNFTQVLARKSATLEYEALPTAAHELARQCVLDYFGVALAGAGDELVRLLLDELAEAGGAPQASIIRHQTRVPVLSAALVNGAAGHALDYDDVNMAMPGHPSVAILPGLLALAELRRSSGREVITAFVAGYETACRIGAAMQPGHYNLGFHSTGTVGAFGAAAACARLLGLDAEATAMALGIAGTQAAGLKSQFGTMCKPFHAGKASQNGLLAARLAARGFSSRADIIECVQGFASTHGPDFSPEAALTTPEAGLHLFANLFKYHAACYLTHAPIECARRLRERHRLTPEAVAGITLRLDASCERVCNIQAPVDGLQSKFSLRQTVAMALAGVDTASLGAYSAENASDPALIDLRERVEIEWQDSWPETVSELEIELTDGRRLTARHDAGIPAADTADQGRRLAAKFEALVEPALGAPRTRELRETIAGLDRLADVADLARLAVGRKVPLTPALSPQCGARGQFDKSPRPACGERVRVRGSTMQDPVVDKIVAHVERVAEHGVPSAARTAAKTFIADTLAVGIAGRLAPWRGEILDMLAGIGGADEATALGGGERLPLMRAAMLNAYQIHAQEFDCVHEAAVVHPMAASLPVLLGWAEREGGVPGARLIRALVVAIDVAATLGLCSRAPMRFFRPANAGGFGATAGLAMLAGLDHAQLRDAIGIYYGQCAGTMQAHSEGTPQLAMQMGFAARSAVTAVELARRGMPGPHAPISGDFGYFALFDGKADPAPFDQLGERWRITELSHKPYPSGRATHGGIDGLRRLMKEDGVTGDRVVTCRFRVPPLTARLVGRPAVEGMAAGYARLCLQYVGAVCLRHGTVGLSDFTAAAFADRNTLRLARRLTVIDDGNPDPNALLPQGVEVDLAEGRTVATAVTSVLGSPNRPLSPEAARAKFRNCWQSVHDLPPEQDTALWEAVFALETLDDVRPLTGLSAPRRAS